MKRIRKSPDSKTRIAPKPTKAGKTLPRGEAPGPDEKRPEVKADEIYGDTQIPKTHRKP
ncbi:MAG: hypothetical protein ABLT11_03000 [Candidatus Acidiferrum sp.]